LPQLPAYHERGDHSQSARDVIEPQHKPTECRAMYRSLSTSWKHLSCDLTR
jgi:hypothetical protein